MAVAHHGNSEDDGGGRGSKKRGAEANLRLDRVNGRFGWTGFIYRLDRPNRRGPVPVYRSGLAGNWSVLVEFKFELKNSVQPVRTGIPAGLTGLNSNPNLKSHV